MDQTRKLARQAGKVARAALDDAGSQHTVDGADTRLAPEPQLIRGKPRAAGTGRLLKPLCELTHRSLVAL